MFDIDDFRALSSDELKNQIWRMTRSRFKVFRHLLSTKPWSFAMCVEIGLDRLHHAFWHFWDTSHPLHPGSNIHSETMLEYYRLLDEEMQMTCDILRDDTVVLIVSDHGAQPMMGGIRINEWLMENGYLVLNHMPASPQALKYEWIDWQRTKAWGEGGYFGRIFLNVKDREPRGGCP